jgi:undecaprenyl-diphosphatase
MTLSKVTFSREKAVATLSAPDYLLMHKVNNWPAPRWVRWWMIAATRGGDGWFWALCGVILIASHDAARFAALIASSLATAVGIVIFRTVKKAVGRKRPCHIATHCWATLLPPDQFSFPSGHTITAFAIAIPLGLFYPGIFAVMLFFAFSIAVSRILLGMHFLSDVLAGAILGVGLGYGSYALVAQNF